LQSHILCLNLIFISISNHPLSANPNPFKKYSMVNIAIAEDDNDDFLLLKEAIEKVLPKFNLTHSKDGRSFLESISVNPDVDLVFLDLNIPKKNGLECLIQLRQQAELQSTPVIIYSTSADVEDIESCYKNGCTLYLVKPTSFTDLVTQVQKVFFRIGLPKKKLQGIDMFVVKS
jgi:CheY-like chemotaxis protein